MPLESAIGRKQDVRPPVPTTNERRATCSACRCWLTSSRKAYPCSVCPAKSSRSGVSESPRHARCPTIDPEPVPTALTADKLFRSADLSYPAFTTRELRPLAGQQRTEDLCIAQLHRAGSRLAWPCQ